MYRSPAERHRAKIARQANKAARKRAERAMQQQREEADRQRRLQARRERWEGLDPEADPGMFGGAGR